MTKRDLLSASAQALHQPLLGPKPGQATKDEYKVAVEDSPIA
ncbi:MAG: hypothetical protein ACRBB6_12665 [Neptuniibacter sp.]